MTEPDVAGSDPTLLRTRAVLDGDEWAGFLVFSLPVSTTVEYRTLLESITRLRLRIAEVPIETGEAGQVTRTTEFEFNFDRSGGQINALSNLTYPGRSRNSPAPTEFGAGKCAGPRLSRLFGGADFA